MSVVGTWRQLVCDRAEPVFRSWEPASLSLCRLTHAHNVLYLTGDWFQFKNSFFLFPPSVRTGMSQADQCLMWGNPQSLNRYSILHLKSCVAFRALCRQSTRDTSRYGTMWAPYWPRQLETRVNVVQWTGSILLASRCCENVTSHKSFTGS